jgi:hypothetical protein
VGVNISAGRDLTHSEPLKMAASRDNRTFIWVIDAQDRIIRVNEAWLTLSL